MTRSPIPALTLAPTLPALPRAMLERLPMSALVELRCGLHHLLADVDATLALRRATAIPSASAATEDLLDVTEAAKRLRMSRTWLYRHADALPFTVRVGASLRFDAVRLAAYLADRRRHGGAA